MKILNAFSLNMLSAFPAEVRVEEIPLDEARELVRRGLESAVGHAETASVFSDALGVPVPAQRVTVSLKSGETALVGQYRGPRLAEGVTTLPEGSTIVWYLVTVR